MKISKKTIVPEEHLFVRLTADNSVDLRVGSTYDFITDCSRDLDFSNETVAQPPLVRSGWIEVRFTNGDMISHAAEYTVWFRERK